MRKLKRVCALFFALVFILTGAVVMPSRSYAVDPYIIYNTNPVTEIKLSIGDGAKLTVFPSSSFSGLIVWVSSDENVATVDGSGESARVTAKSGGSCTITAMSGGVKASVTVNVGSFSVVSSMDMGVGYKKQLYTGTPEGSVKVKVNKKKVCSVSKKGVVTGKKPGSCKITVTSGGRSYTCRVKVNAVKYDTNYQLQLVNKGDTFKTGLLYADKEKVSIVAADPEIVSFEGTMGKGLKSGLTDYTIKCKGKTYKGTIYVIDGDSKTFMLLNDGEKEIHMKSGETLDIPCCGVGAGTLQYFGSNEEVLSMTLGEYEKIIHGVGSMSWKNNISLSALSPGECTIKFYLDAKLQEEITVVVE